MKCQGARGCRRRNRRPVALQYVCSTWVSPAVELEKKACLPRNAAMRHEKVQQQHRELTGPSQAARRSRLSRTNKRKRIHCAPIGQRIRPHLVAMSRPLPGRSPSQQRTNATAGATCPGSAQGRERRIRLSTMCLPGTCTPCPFPIVVKPCPALRSVSMFVQFFVASSWCSCTCWRRSSRAAA